MIQAQRAGSILQIGPRMSEKKDTLFYLSSQEITVRIYTKNNSLLKGIVQPFELGGETRLILSGVKYYVTGKF
jgi:hypothetical protein